MEGGKTTIDGVTSIKKENQSEGIGTIWKKLGVP